MEHPPFDSQITFLYVADLDRSSAFYGDTLGLELARDQGARRIYRVRDGAYVGLCSHRPPEPGGVIVTLVADDVDAWAYRLAVAGHEVDGPHANERFELYHLFVRDPDGHLVEIEPGSASRPIEVTRPGMFAHPTLQGGERRRKELESAPSEGAGDGLSDEAKPRVPRLLLLVLVQTGGAHDGTRTAWSS